MPLLSKRVGITLHYIEFKQEHLLGCLYIEFGGIITPS